MALQDADLTPVQEKLKARHLQAVEELGTGTFATIYRVVDCKNREFALKTLFSSPDNALMLSTRARIDTEIKRVFTQLIDAVGYCHSLGVAHRDLKPENIFVSADHTFAIGNFGLATSFSWGIASEAGSRPYKAPESFPGVSKDKYDTRAADVWALGITLINIICGFMPWNAAAEEEGAFSLFRKDPYHLNFLPSFFGCDTALFARLRS
ncbi:kinase-like domain-containing protein [Vararia minispora EC-137]|uniref:Kinase-like domain-containing protein n=1 Tax=Vararia minispora EC-137 TaxID=1314806 RepID=A0ACB8QJS1_9AGAM|nr:kinase-like domain-containing protein [Vararia minispora EC-137]